jgi:hypothetical protein
VPMFVSRREPTRVDIRISWVYIRTPGGPLRDWLIRGKRKGMDLEIR